MERGQRVQGEPQGKKTYKETIAMAAAAAAIIAVLALLVYFVIYFFQVEEIEVTGVEHSSEQEVLQWVQEDPYSVNSLYVYWKYNRKDILCPPAIKKVKAALKAPGKVQITVEEKEFCGYTNYHDAYLYFDAQGIASLETQEVIEGAVYIEGMELKDGEFALGERMATADEGLPERLCGLLVQLKEFSLSPELITCTPSGLVLHFGNVRVHIGNGGFAEKLSHIEVILQKKEEVYPGIGGDFHMESFSSGDEVRFKPDEQ